MRRAFSNIPSKRSGPFGRKPGGVSTPKFPQLRELAVGESLVLPITAGNKYVSCYAMAKNAGIRVSVRVIDNETVRVTRKA
jgi:hypothetical protein